jgi:hypothetical protein
MVQFHIHVSPAALSGKPDAAYGVSVVNDGIVV